MYVARVIIFSALLTVFSSVPKNIFAAPPPTPVPSSPTFTLSPSIGTAEVGATIAVDIVLDTGGKPTYGMDINKIHFDPDFLQAVQVRTTSILPNVVVNEIDNTAGTITLSKLGTPGSTFTSSGVVATVTFRVRNVGTSDVTFDFVPGNGLDSNIAGLGGDILASVGKGTYTGIPAKAPLPLPPTPSAAPIPTEQPQPSATPTPTPTVQPTDLPIISAIKVRPTPTSATITFTTSQGAISSISYGTSSRYSNILPFTSSFVVSHSRTITNLKPSTIYHYRIRVQNARGDTLETSDGAFMTLGASVPIPSATVEPNSSPFPQRPPVSLPNTVSNNAHNSLPNTNSNTVNPGNTIRNFVPVIPTIQRKVTSSGGGSGYTGDSSSEEVVDNIEETYVIMGELTTHKKLTFTVWLKEILYNWFLRISGRSKSSAIEATMSTSIPRIDISYMNNRWNTNDALVDLNKDGKVNTLDYAIMSRNWTN